MAKRGSVKKSLAKRLKAEIKDLEFSCHELEVRLRWSQERNQLLLANYISTSEQREESASWRKENWRLKRALTRLNRMKVETRMLKVVQMTAILTRLAS